MTIYTIVGSVAAFCTTFAMLPQIIKTFKTRETEDLSLLMISMLALGTFLWTIYGISRSDTVLIVANVVTFTFAMSLVVLKLKHG